MCCLCTSSPICTSTAFGLPVSHPLPSVYVDLKQRLAASAVPVHFRFLFGTPLHHTVQASVSRRVVHHAFAARPGLQSRTHSLSVRTAAIEATAHCAWHCCPSPRYVVFARCSHGTPWSQHRVMSYSLLALRHRIRCSFSVTLVGTGHQARASVVIFGLVMSARIASPCLQRPRFELRLPSRAPQASAKRVRQSCSIKSRTLRSSLTMYSMLARPRLTSRYR